MGNKGKLFVISGPSGSGKGTIVKELTKEPNSIFVSVSATTRQPREGEVNGISYHFFSEEQFEELVQTDGFLEYAGYCENRYGTPRKPVDEAMAAGKDVILEIDVQGAIQVKAKRPEAVLIFLLPPSMEILAHRLHKRGTETEEKVQKRLAKVQDELKYRGLYDYTVVNDKLEEAVADFKAIFRAEHLKEMDCSGWLIYK